MPLRLLQAVEMTVMLANGTIAVISPQRNLHLWRAWQVRQRT